jgi:hypothetical protein
VEAVRHDRVKPAGENLGQLVGVCLHGRDSAQPGPGAAALTRRRDRSGSG